MKDVKLFTKVLVGAATIVGAIAQTPGVTNIMSHHQNVSNIVFFVAVVAAIFHDPKNPPPVVKGD